MPNTIKEPDLHNRSGVYVIVHNASGKLYVGSAVNIVKRFREHRRKLRNREHDSPRLQAAWNKHGESGFAFSVVQFRPIPDLIATEQRWIDEFDACGERGYNSCPTAGNCLGRKLDPEVVERIASKHRGKKLSPEHIAAIKAANTGRPKPPGTGAKISAAKKGIRTVILGPESLAIISAKLKGRKQPASEVANRVASRLINKEYRENATQGRLFD